MAAVDIVGLSKRFGETEAVRDVSFAVAEGEFIALLGPSGCGKSTTLALIAGFEQPDAGEIRIDGREVSHLPPQARPVGVVLQDFGLFPRLSVARNIGFGLDARGVSRAERDKRVTAIAARLGVSSLLPFAGGALDLADMQRVAMARTLVTEPRVLLLDEPMSSLDASLREALRDELKALQQALGQTVIHVTHDQAEAMAMADRIAVMDRGAILQFGSPRHLYERPVNRFVASFLGEPSINLIPAVMTRAQGLSLAIADLLPPLPPRRNWKGPRDVLLALRPHHVEIGVPDGPPAIVEAIERDGARLTLHLAIGDLRLAASTSAEGLSIGSTTSVRLRVDGALLIDPATGTVIAGPEGFLPS